MEFDFLGFLSFLEGVDFASVFRILGIGFCVFWIVVVGWVVYDAIERFKSVVFVILSAVLTLVLPIFGLIIYLIIRPKVTKDDQYWAEMERNYLRLETSGIVDCPKCKYHIQPNFIFCPRCGESVRRKCKGCDIYLEPEWYVCPFCGAKQYEGVAIKEKSAVEVNPGQNKQSQVQQTQSQQTPSVNQQVSQVTSEVTPTPTAQVSETQIPDTQVGQPATSVQAVPAQDSPKKKGLVLGLDGFVRSFGAFPSKLKSAFSGRRTKNSNVAKPSNNNDGNGEDTSNQQNGKKQNGKHHHGKHKNRKNKK